MKKPQTIALVFLLAILLSIQVRAAQDAEKYVSLNEIQTYTQELERESAELNQLVERVRLMTLQISEYENSKAESGGIEEAMINQIEKN